MNFPKWADKHMSTIWSYIDVFHDQFLFPLVAFYFPLLSAFLLSPPVKVVGKFKVKASLHNDLYLREADCEARYVTVLLPAATENNEGTRKVTLLKQKQSNMSRLES